MKNEILAIFVISMFLLVGIPSVTAPSIPDIEFTGKIKMINSDDSSNY